MIKEFLNNYAIYGGSPLFSKVKPTSNLVKPNRSLLKKYFNHYLSYGHNTIIRLLEERLASFHKVKHCITFNSGFWALAQSIRCISTPQKNEVIIPSLTYRRLGDLVSWCGKTPVFCDISKKTLALCNKSVQSECSKDTSLIIGVHPVGDHIDIDGLTSIAKEYNIPIIFDSVESVAESHHSKILGNNGDLEVYSLGASKLINGFEGGYITTNSDNIARKIRKNSKFDGSESFLNIPLPGINASAALSSLEEIAIQIKKNKLRFETYKKGLELIPEIRLKEQCLKTKPSYKNIIVELLENWPLSIDDTIKILNAENILARKYCPPITDNHLLYNFRQAKLKNTDWAKNRFISMPCGHLVSEIDIKKIISLLLSIKNHFNIPSTKLKNIKVG